MGVGKWATKAVLTGGISTLSPKSGVTAKGQRKRQIKQLKKQTNLMEQQNAILSQQQTQAPGQSISHNGAQWLQQPDGSWAFWNDAVNKWVRYEESTMPLAPSLNELGPVPGQSASPQMGVVPPLGDYLRPKQ